MYIVGTRSGSPIVLHILQLSLEYFLEIYKEQYFTEKCVDERRYIPTMPYVAERASQGSWMEQSVAVIGALVQAVYTDGAACGGTSIANLVKITECSGYECVTPDDVYRRCSLCMEEHRLIRDWRTGNW